MKKHVQDFNRFNISEARTHMLDALAELYRTLETAKQQAAYIGRYTETEEARDAYSFTGTENQDVANRLEEIYAAFTTGDEKDRFTSKATFK